MMLLQNKYKDYLSLVASYATVYHAPFSILDKIMDFFTHCIRPLSEPVQIYYQLEFCEQTSVKFEAVNKIFFKGNAFEKNIFYWEVLFVQASLQEFSTIPQKKFESITMKRAGLNASSGILQATGLERNFIGLKY